MNEREFHVSLFMNADTPEGKLSDEVEGMMRICMSQILPQLDKIQAETPTIPKRPCFGLEFPALILDPTDGTHRFLPRAPYPGGVVKFHAEEQDNRVWYLPVECGEQKFDVCCKLEGEMTDTEKD